MTVSGKLITIEGVEGVGKSTAIRYLETLLQTHHVEYVVTREPGGTEIAEDIRQILLSHHEEPLMPYTELFLMFASRVQHIAHVVLPALKAGTWVLSDRFTDASFAYQGGGREIPKTQIEALAKWTGADIQPDLTLLLDAPLNVGFDRMKNREKDRIESEKRVFFERVRQTYLDLAKTHPEHYNIVSADQPLEQVKVQLSKAMERLWT